MTGSKHDGIITASKELSKGWDWSLVTDGYWKEVSDEFFPVALRWKNLGEKSVLDLGCGVGRHALFLAEMDFEVTATDISTEGIAKLKRTAIKKGLENKIQTVVCDMLEIPFENNSFDCVVGFHSIYHTDYAGLKTVVQRITEILTSKGQLYITFNSKNNPSFRSSTNVKVDDYTVLRHHGIEQNVPHTYLDYEDVLKLLDRYNMIRIRQIQDYFDKQTSIHFFVEAQKKN